MNQLHAQESARRNARRPEKPMYCVGDFAWYRGPREDNMAAAKLIPRWTFVQVVRREGQASYVVKPSGGRERAAHESQLKPYVKDCFGKPTQLLY